jgi:hypothetical protein
MDVAAVVGLRQLTSVMAKAVGLTMVRFGGVTVACLLMLVITLHTCFLMQRWGSFPPFFN